MNTSHLDPKHLQVIQLVAQTRSVSGAAKRLFVTQSAVSHQLSDIEARAGERLFVRGRSLRLTLAGRALLNRAAPLLRELARFRADSAERRVLRVTTGCYTSYHWLPKVVRTLSRDDPALDVQIVLEATRRPLPALDAGEVDVAVTTEAPKQKRFATRALFQDELVALLAADHPLASRKRLDPVSLAGERVLVYDAPLSELDVWTRFLRPAGASACLLQRVPLTESIVQLTRAGFGVGILSSWMAEPYLAQGGLARARLGRGLQRTWWAVSLAPMRSAATMLADALSSSVSS